MVVAGTAPIGADGKTAEGGPYGQAKRCFEIIVTALAELGATPSNVVRTRMYITDPQYAADVGRAHRETFGDAPPAATMVVTQLLDPEWACEIEAEARGVE